MSRSFSIYSYREDKNKFAWLKIVVLNYIIFLSEFVPTREAIYRAPFIIRMERNVFVSESIEVHLCPETNNMSDSETEFEEEDHSGSCCDSIKS